MRVFGSAGHWQKWRVDCDGEGSILFRARPSPPFRSLCGNTLQGTGRFIDPESLLRPSSAASTLGPRLEESGQLFLVLFMGMLVDRERAQKFDHGVVIGIDGSRSDEGFELSRTEDLPSEETPHPANPDSREILPDPWKLEAVLNGADRFGTGDLSRATEDEKISFRALPKARLGKDLEKRPENGPQIFWRHVVRVDPLTHQSPRGHPAPAACEMFFGKEV